MNNAPFEQNTAFTLDLKEKLQKGFSKGRRMIKQQVNYICLLFISHPSFLIPVRRGAAAEFCEFLPPLNPDTRRYDFCPRV